MLTSSVLALLGDAAADAANDNNKLKGLRYHQANSTYIFLNPITYNSLTNTQDVRQRQ